MSKSESCTDLSALQRHTGRYSRALSSPGKQNWQIFVHIVNSLIYRKEEEISPDTWIVEISVSYKYEGILSPVGPSNGEGIDILYQESPIGFLITKDGNSYSLQSRYE